MTILVGLDEQMRARRATNVQLEEVSGVSARTIQSARRGKPVRSFLATAIVEALLRNTFTGTGHVNNWASRRV